MSGLKSKRDMKGANGPKSDESLSNPTLRLCHRWGCDLAGSAINGQLVSVGCGRLGENGLKNTTRAWAMSPDPRFLLPEMLHKQASEAWPR